MFAFDPPEQTQLPPTLARETHFPVGTQLPGGVEIASALIVTALSRPRVKNGFCGDLADLARL